VNGDAAADQFISAVRTAERSTARLIVARLRSTPRPHAWIRSRRSRRWESFRRSSRCTPITGRLAPRLCAWPERAVNISPTGWAIERGMIFTSHHDARWPCRSDARALGHGHPRDAQRAGSRPRAPHDADGGAEDPYALVGVPALREQSKGSLEVGKLADFTVLDANPITIDPMKIADIKVMETIKEGSTVYRRDTGHEEGGRDGELRRIGRLFPGRQPGAGRAGVIHSHDHDE